MHRNKIQEKGKSKVNSKFLFSKKVIKKDIKV